MSGRRNYHICLNIALLIFGSFLTVSEARADQYFNSTEPGCDGSDPNVLWCDDFEDGSWYYTTEDKNYAPNDGWNGGVYGSADPQGTQFGRCGGLGAAGTNCTATSGFHNGSIGQAPAMADHDLKNLTSVSELYVRYYVKPLAGFSYGHEKMLTLNKCCAGVGGIDFGTISAYFSSGQPTWYVAKEDAWRSQNQGNTITLVGGNWYYLEYHFLLNVPGVSNGIYEMWADNCGANGLGCTGPGTLRARFTNVKYVNSGDSSQIGSIWLENWGNAGSTGEEYYDQIKVSRARVGPMASALDKVPPAAPSNLR